MEETFAIKDGFLEMVCALPVTLNYEGKEYLVKDQTSILTVYGSPEDGEAAFNMFVNKFKEIGSQSGIKIDSFKNRL